MATLTATPLAAAGVLNSTSAAAGGGDKVKPQGDHVWIEVTNGSGGSINVTIPSYPTVRGQAVTDRVVAVAASATKKIPIYEDLNTNPADGLAAITYSAVTSVTVGAYRL
ncbi:hypothetical protein OOK29_26090 [Streptomyces phaeochromogenes]|uniref:hypothetical protein n=1 Tax=Streptomyces phaeochromogenes TaxID=1923 RepID=UPI00224F084D|nr:hypothetical protein [Streptomyces phaeochromogenes]MCX5601626.1 hypothetical protein [Streptomyces phaeochromogenes]